jgi:hypothetical protein
VAIICRSQASTGGAEGLARESSGDNINGLEVMASALSDVAKPLCCWEMSLKHPPAIFVNFYLPNRLKSCPLKPKIKSTYASEK